MSSRIGSPHLGFKKHGGRRRPGPKSHEWAPPISRVCGLHGSLSRKTWQTSGVGEVSQAKGALPRASSWVAAVVLVAFGAPTAISAPKSEDGAPEVRKVT